MPNGLRHIYTQVEDIVNDDSVSDSVAIKLSLSLLAQVIQHQDSFMADTRDANKARQDIDEQIIDRLEKIDVNLREVNETLSNNPLVEWGKLLKDHPTKAKIIATVTFLLSSSLYIKESRDVILEAVLKLLGL